MTLTPQTTFVLLMGYKQSGKDTSAQGLVRDLGFVRQALADPLKEMAYAINPGLACGYLADVVDDIGWDRAKQNPLVREFLQRLGTEGIRKYVGADFWANLLLSRTHGTPKVVVPDVRFGNELFLLRDGPNRRALSIWIRRDGCEASNHASENSLGPQDADIILDNNGSASEIQALVVRAVRETFGIH